MPFDREMQRALEADGEKLRQLSGEEHGPVFENELTPIFEALRANEISAADAIERVLYHPSYGGNRDDAESLVEEWSVQINQQEEAASLHGR